MSEIFDKRRKAADPPNQGITGQSLVKYSMLQVLLLSSFIDICLRRCPGFLKFMGGKASAIVA